MPVLAGEYPGRVSAAALKLRIRGARLRREWDATEILHLVPVPRRPQVCDDVLEERPQRWERCADETHIDFDAGAEFGGGPVPFCILVSGAVD